MGETTQMEWITEQKRDDPSSVVRTKERDMAKERT